MFVVEEKPHDIFERLEQESAGFSNLKMKLEISFAESIVGFTKKIKFLNGNDIVIKMDTPVRHGDTFVAKDHGMPILGNQNTKGELFVEVFTDHPSELKLTSGNRQRLWQIFTGESLKVDTDKHKNLLNLVTFDEYKKEAMKEAEKQQGRRGRHQNMGNGAQQVQCAQQ